MREKERAKGIYGHVDKITSVRCWWLSSGCARIYMYSSIYNIRGAFRRQSWYENELRGAGRIYAHEMKPWCTCSVPRLLSRICTIYNIYSLHFWLFQHLRAPEDRMKYIQTRAPRGKSVLQYTRVSAPPRRRSLYSQLIYMRVVEKSNFTLYTLFADSKFIVNVWGIYTHRIYVISPNSRWCGISSQGESWWRACR